jgi:glycosyltransferase involved in cell wall biosynthesis
VARRKYVVSFANGPAARAAAMRAELREILPGYEHHSGDGLNWLELIHRFPPFSIAHTAALLGPETDPRVFQRALALAPTRMLAYDPRGDRFHLHPRQPISSFQFLNGVPAHEIHLRPWRDDTLHYPGFTTHSGRPAADGRKRAAILSPYIPWPLSHGGAVRIYNLLREGAKHFDLVLFSFSEDAAPPDLAPLLQICHRIHLVRKPRFQRLHWASLLPPEVIEYSTPSMREALASANFDFLQTEFTMLAGYGGDVLVEHDITMDLARQEFDRTGSARAWWDWWRWRNFERRALRRFPRVAVMSAKDQAQLSLDSIHVLPNGVDLDRYQPVPESTGLNLLFIGSFRHYPNSLAYRFLAEEVWPALSAEEPGARLEVIAGPQPELYYPFGAIPMPEGIELRAFVGDVRPSYRQANVVLIPTPVSAGTNIKALEAMAMERAIVSTTSGMNGLDAGMAVIADGAEAFTKAILRLLRDPRLRRATAAKARAYVESGFSWTAIGEAQRNLWNGL